MLRHYWDLIKVLWMRLYKLLNNHHHGCRASRTAGPYVYSIRYLLHLIRQINISNMKKVVFVFFLGLMFFQSAKAQKSDTLLYFLKNSGEIVANANNADYVIRLMPPDSTDQNLYIVTEYYANGHRKLLGKSINSSLPLKFQGPLVEYNTEGRKVSFQTVENGETKGDIISYYPNGKVYAIFNPVANDPEKIYLKEYRDSTGKVMCENGNGLWVHYDREFKYADGGAVKNGFPDGEWKGKIADSLQYVCNYKKGKVISGIGYDKKGRAYPFEQIKVPPGFNTKTGSSDFNQFVQRYMHIPDYAKEHDIHGRVIIGFTVGADGVVIN